MKRLIIIAMIAMSAASAGAQSEAKTGWTFGVLPSVAYDADLGFQYGALTNLYYYGDGSTYPEYLHSIYAEVNRTTKQSGLFRLNLDSRALVPGLLISADISYMPDEMCDFSGFNGHQAVVNPSWADDSSDGYRSRAFYKHYRNLFRTAFDFQGNIGGKFNWNAGIGLLVFNAKRVNLDKLNRGQSDDKKLPDIDVLFDKYLQWGLIDSSETRTGTFPYIHGGVSYDSRNRTAAPSSGIWADAFVTYTAAFGSLKQFNSLKLNADFRHYLALGTPIAVLAYRLSAQLTLAGKTPFYMASQHNVLNLKRAIYESLGGSSSLRGITRNRIVSDGFALANIELRLRLVKFDIGSSHFYVATNPFVDAGMVLQPIDVDERQVSLAVSSTGDNADDYFDFAGSIYRPHISGGAGLKVAMNENFILSVDWATPFSSKDSDKKSNIYVKMGYLF
ncbi:MAG: BamA/TamA family outer membrane protein [Salinivirgaceae bacterium]|nr:BamA/TamA family outer membrane protein [Salinivirgaceae bacterium]